MKLINKLKSLTLRDQLCMNLQGLFNTFIIEGIVDSRNMMNGYQFLFKRRIFLPLLLILCLLFLSACQPAAAPAIQTPTISKAAPTLEETPQAQVTPTEALQSTLSEQPYASPSGAFEIYFPKDWICSETGQYRVDCQSPDGKANITMRATATGYELIQEAFDALITAEVVYTYSEKKAYSEISHETEEGLVSISAAWREGAVPWQSKDVFTRSGAGVYQLSLSAEQAQWDEYALLFDQVIEKVAFHPETISGSPIYAQTRKYDSPDLLFILEVPTAWSKYTDDSSIENTHLEGFISPDKHAAVQIAIYRQDSLIKQEAKAFKTLEILRKINGYDLRVPKNGYSNLADGRERLTWYADKRNINGISYFDSFSGSLYIFSVVWDNDFKDMYELTLNSVVDSFGHN
jgi:hypothetical protein